MDCISIYHKKADVSVRARFSLSVEKSSELLRYIIDTAASRECVVLSTCNRTEIYYSNGRRDEVVAALSLYSGVASKDINKYVLLYCGDKAVEHLFRVACGMDSMVVGEDEILGQTKSAYALSQEENAAGYETNVVFQAAIACAKRVKTETALSKTSVSVATLAANEAAKLSERVSVLVIGASGKIGMSTLKNLLGHKNVTVTATLRHGSLRGEELRVLGVEIVSYNERYEHIARADCVISATASPHYTVTSYDLRQSVRDDKSRLFIDLAVPPDIDPSVTELGGVTLINIDRFEELAKENNDLKLSCLDEAERIIAEELDTLRKDMRFHEFLPYFEGIKGESLQLDKLVYKMRAQASAAAFSEFLGVISGEAVK